MKIYIWGTGGYTENFLKYTQSIFKDIVGFIETERSKNTYYRKPVLLPSDIKNEDFDFIIVASQFVHEIKANIYMRGLDLKKVIFLPAVWIPVEIKSGNLFFLFERAKTSPVINAVFFPSDGMYSTSKKIIDTLQRNISLTTYWKENQIYDTKIQLPHIHFPQKKMINDLLIPVLKNTDTVFDLACASGEWSRFISNYVKKVDGFDISSQMIKNAKKISLDYGFNNVHFSCTSADSIDLKKKYNHSLMLGLLTCIETNEQVNYLLENISNLIKSGGCLVVRETLSMYTDLPVYNYIESGKLQSAKIKEEKYLAIYRPIKKYMSLFEKNGFSLIEERYFCSYMHNPIEVGSHGFVFRKTD